MALVLPLLLARTSGANNLECIGGDCRGPGYAVYRSGNPGEDEWRAVCGPWKTDFIVLDDNHWQKREADYRSHCPRGTVVYARSQDLFRSLDTGFLAVFDEVIARAKAEGRKILFHCKLGTHRTGRLAAYYELKDEGWTLSSAMEDFNQHISFVTRLYAFHLNSRVRHQILGIEAFLRNASTCQGRAHADCVVVTSPDGPRDPALLEAEKRLRSE